MHLSGFGLGSLLVASLLDGGPDVRPAAVPAVAPSGRVATARAVDLAICLDTSGSMEGLIDAARQKLWAIVNDLALAQPPPKLRVALLTYGNDGHDAAAGWVAVDSGFTDDLDAISQKLFALKTNGGTELVARVLKVARELPWSPGDDALKLAIVAGNESAEQDAAVNFRDVCHGLIESGVIVDSIYCGNPADELAPAWQEVARAADGQFASIDQQNGTVVIATPFDAELAHLSGSINDTYLAYGTEAKQWSDNQKAQDMNAEGCSSAAAATRACTKGCNLYKCSWDLVEQVKSGTVKLEDVKKEELPEKLREFTLEQTQKCVDEAWGNRQAIQKMIQAIGALRDQFVADEVSQRGSKDEAAFDHAVRDAIRRQAEAKGFTFTAPKPIVKE